jgi:hypothetical protein
MIEVLEQILLVGLVVFLALFAVLSTALTWNPTPGLARREQSRGHGARNPLRATRTGWRSGTATGDPVA